MRQSHTPLPWVVEFDEYAGYDCMTGGYYIKSSETPSIVTVLDAKLTGENPAVRADADFIVRAVNSHYDLLEALKLCAQACDEALEDDWDRSDKGFEDMRDMCKAAIAKAEEATQ